MIIGIGNDKIDISRIERTLAQFGDRFLNRIYTPLEQAKAQRRAGGQDNRVRGMAPTLAKRFAAKEACAKALGTGLAQGVFWRDMGVENLASGKPTLILTGGAAAKLAELVQELAPPGHKAVVHLALTDDYPWAEAQVIIEALPVKYP